MGIPVPPPPPPPGATDEEWQAHFAMLRRRIWWIRFQTVLVGGVAIVGAGVIGFLYLLRVCS